MTFLAPAAHRAAFLPLRLPRAVALLAVGLVLSAPPALAQFGPQGPPAVGVLAVERRPVTESTEFVGRVEAQDRVDLRARVTGFLQERPFREGQEVTAGQVLFRLERPPFEAEVARARATVASAEAELQNANSALARARDLVRSSAGTQVNVENATAAQRTAQATLLGAQAQLRVAEINLGYTDIATPFAGKVGRATFSVGAVVGPSTDPLATVVSQDPMRVAFRVNLRTGTELRDRYASRGGAEATRVRIRLVTGQIYNQVGRIDFIDTQVDRNTDTVLVRALIPNPPRGANNSDGSVDRELIDGMFVNVTVEGAEPVQAVVIPRSAVLQDQAGNYVWVLDAENKPARRPLVLGRSIADQVVVESGLETGERVVVEGVQRVRPGQAVQPGPATAPIRAPGAAPAGRQG
ncbi:MULTISPECIES: efflux RND transporter periplasmic adaptor subunit [Roseomonadaceae]|uniref:Efflux RND transporter periplasmic adaptor subunit n=1 Tax=Falsiroseomonas oleicola TaxID=2801474 RepID=A0ABS6HB40_9PROT|nr:efflux RND transporter periplasmic adaptor subunit [Roseomonas oleicola]MBU8544706.1 efflux RND transporter periplasmic adaptor subunit [Roseomonas oleicola]